MNNGVVDIEKINFFNPWYKNNNFLYQRDVKLQKRRQFHEVKECLYGDSMVSLIGLRRTGKTTIIRQLINYLLDEKGISPEKIFVGES